MSRYFKKRSALRRKEWTLPEKTNRILNGILIALLLIIFRIWHLAVIQHEQKVQEASRPQKRVVITRAERATIQDREGVPLAINKVQYNAAILYSRIREIPRFVWKRDEKKKRYKIFNRNEYISRLAVLLARELQLDKERVEDLIHAKAAIFGSIPLVIKENIDERAYYRLKMLEKDWPGIFAEISSKRCYPLGPIGGEIVGYMGAINEREYEKITSELKTLQESLTMWEEGDENPLPPGFNSICEVEKRLQELEKKAYHINDRIGKAGVEGAFEEDLRGFRGKKTFLSDPRGNFLRELVGGEETTPGKQIRLTINAKLQEYGEKLLGEYEKKKYSWLGKGELPENRPWIKGGAIVVMDPQNGEILALSSYPRFDPNDFTHSHQRVHKWLEDETYLAALWNQKEPISRETFNVATGQFETIEEILSWDTFLSMILPPKSPVRQKLAQINQIKDAALLDKLTGQLLSFFTSFEEEFDPLLPSKIFDFIYQGENHIPQGIVLTLPEKESFATTLEKYGRQIQTLKEALHPYFASLPMNFEKILLVDLCRLAVDTGRFTPSLMELIGEQEINEYKMACASFAAVSQKIKEVAKDIFKKGDFQRWREENFKNTLLQKRAEEKKKKIWARPYIDYLDEAFTKSFAAFWEEKKWEALALFLTGEKQFLSNDSALQELILNLEGYESDLRSILINYDSSLIIPYLKTLRNFEDLTRPLLGRYFGVRKMGSRQLELDLATAFYPKYGYGFARSYCFRAATTIGSIFKLVPAYVALTQRYCALKESGNSFSSLNPLTIIDDKRRDSSQHGGWSVGKTVEGRQIPMFYKGGKLPRSLHSGVGKIDLIGAIEASSNPYFSLLAGEVIEDPQDLINATLNFSFGEKTGIDLPNEFKGNVPLDILYNRTGLYSMAIGQHELVGTPLQVAVMLCAIGNGGSILKPKILLEEEEEVVRKIFLPGSVRDLLLKGMQQVIWGGKGTARLVRSMSIFKEEGFDLTKKVVGKTSTAESVEYLSVDKRPISNHVWFGAISFEKPGVEYLHDNAWEKPELVVIVYLRFGSYGNEAAPLALKMIKKWKELQTSN